MNNATATLSPVRVSASDSTAYVDGVEQSIDCYATAGDASVGYPAGFEVEPCGDPVMVDRKEWDAAHPGVEPTVEAMRALVDAALESIADHAADYRHDHPPEPDFDFDDDMGDY